MDRYGSDQKTQDIQLKDSELSETRELYRKPEQAQRTEKDSEGRKTQESLPDDALFVRPAAAEQQLDESGYHLTDQAVKGFLGQEQEPALNMLREHAAHRQTELDQKQAQALHVQELLAAQNEEAGDLNQSARTFSSTLQLAEKNEAPVGEPLKAAEEQTDAAAPDLEPTEPQKNDGPVEIDLDLPFSMRLESVRHKEQETHSSKVPYIDDNEELDFSGIPLETRLISEEEYTWLADSLDTLPLADIGLYHRMKAKNEDVRIYGGYIQDELAIAMIVRMSPAWKVFRWMEAPFGPISRNPLDGSLLVKLIQGIEDLEDSDSLLYLRLESFIEYQQHNREGLVAEGWNHKDWRQQLMGLKMQAMPLQTGFEPGRQARYAALIELAEDSALYQGLPVSSASMEDPRAILMKTRHELLDAMSPQTRARLEAAAKPYIQVRLLNHEELPLVDELLPGAMDQEPLDLSYLDAYQGESAMVLVTMDISAYVQDFMQQYDAVSEELQQAFFDAQHAPRSKTRKKELLAAMKKMKEWDVKLDQVQKLQQTGKEQLSLAAGLYLFNATETMCLWSARHPHYPHLNGLEAMHWFMADWSRSRHALRYTFWGMSGNTAPGEEGYEAYAFARDFGARLQEFSGAFVAAFKPGSTRAYQAYLKSRNLQ